MVKYEENSQEFLKALIDKKADEVSYFIKKYTPILTKMALRQGFSTEVTEDLTQQTWETFFNKLEDFQQKSKLSSFLVGILLNKCREHKRKHVKETLVEDSSDEIFFRADGHWKTQEKTPQELTEVYQDLNRVQTAIEQLPDIQQKVLFLKLVEGETTKTICEILEITANNLNVILYRAKMNLRMILSKT